MRRHLFFILTLVIVACVPACKKKNGSGGDSALADNLGIVSLHDSVMDFKGMFPMFALDMDGDLNADVLIQYHINSREDDQPGLATLSGNKLIIPVQTLTSVVNCVNNGTTTSSVGSFNLMQKWNFSGDVVNTTDTAGSAPISLIFSDTNPSATDTDHCKHRLGSKAGDKNEGYIVLRRNDSGKMKMGWLRCRYSGDSLLTFISFKKLLEVSSLKLP